MQEEIVIEKREKEDWVYLYPLYKAEKNISDRLLTLNSCKNVKYIKNFSWKNR